MSSDVAESILNKPPAQPREQQQATQRVFQIVKQIDPTLFVATSVETGGLEPKVGEPRNLAASGLEGPCRMRMEMSELRTLTYMPVRTLWIATHGEVVVG